MIGNVINERYEITGELGVGGMGVVFLASDISLKRDVALKLLKNSPMMEDLGTAGRAQILHEAQLVAQLNHPNIVTVFDVGTYDDAPYIVMELAQGSTLPQQQIEDLSLVIEYARQICEALNHAHARGVVHRDLKHENIILQSDGALKLMDFGLAFSTAARMDDDGYMRGTFHYISPEQIHGTDQDGRSDLYALGVMLYRMVTGEFPFDEPDPVAIISHHLNTQPMPPYFSNPQLTPQFNDLILSLLEKDREQRPASAADLLEIFTSDLLKMKTEEIAREDVSPLDRILRGRMIGRDEELAQMQAVWLQAMKGKGHTLFVSGEAGVGKSRLVRELTALAEASGGLTFAGEAYAESNYSYGAFSQIIRQMIERGAADVPDAVLAEMLQLAPELAHRYPDIQYQPLPDEAVRQQRLLTFLTQYLAAWANETPLLLLIDDLHWADEGTLTLFEHLIRNIEHLPIIMLGAFRDSEVEKESGLAAMLVESNRQRRGTQISLDRLTQQQVDDLLAVIFKEPCSDAFGHAIYERTNGNPFYVEEFCRTLIDQNLVQFEDGRWHYPGDMDELELPHTIQEMILTRLSGLPNETKGMLSVAAIMGREFDFEILSAVSDLDADSALASIEVVEKMQILETQVSGGEISMAFAHALVPEAIRGSLHILRKHRLHQQVGRAYETQQPENYAALAYHFAEGGAAEKAFLYLMQAGEQVFENHIHQDAIRYFKRALDFSTDDVASAKLNYKLAWSFRNIGQYDLAIERSKLCIALAKKTNQQDLLAGGYAYLAHAYGSNSDHAQGLDYALEGLKATERNAPSEGLAKLLAATQRMYHSLGEGEIGIEYNKRALEMAEALDLRHIKAYMMLILAIMHTGSYQEVIDKLKENAAYAEENQLIMRSMYAYGALGWHQWLYFLDYQGAQESYAHSIELAKKIGMRAREIQNKIDLIWMKILMGQLHEAKSMLDGLRENFHEITPGSLAYREVLTFEVCLTAYQGDFEQAIEEYDTLKAEFYPDDDPEIVKILIIKMIPLMRLGRFEEAEKLAELTVSLNDRGLGDANNFGRSMLTQICGLAGKKEKTQRVFKEIEDKTGEVEKSSVYQSNYLVAKAHALAAAENWEAAFETFETYMEDIVPEHRHMRADVTEQWGDVHLMRGLPEDVERAKEYYAQAMTEFVDMGADAWAEHIGKKLEGLE